MTLADVLLAFVYIIGLIFLMALAVLALFLALYALYRLAVAVVNKVCRGDDDWWLNGID